jgi:hypothetical protein
MDLVVQQQAIDEINEREAVDGETALRLLQAVYRNKRAPLSIRMRAAALCCLLKVPSSPRPRYCMMRTLSRLHWTEQSSGATQVRCSNSRPMRLPMTDRLHLVADNTRSWEWESFPRREPRPARERLANPAKPVSTCGSVKLEPVLPREPRPQSCPHPPTPPEELGQHTERQIPVRECLAPQFRVCRAVLHLGHTS